MTNKQKIELRLSKVRSRLNEIAGLDAEAFTTEVREELDALEGEYGDLERRHRAAILSQADEEAAAIGMFPDGDDQDGAEVRQLLGRVTLADYLGPAAAGGGIRGAAAELNAALGVPEAGKSGGVAVPWRMLLQDGGVEARAFTTTSQNDGPQLQRPILQRLFGPGIMDTLGVRIDSVPVGRTEWPLFATGVTPGMVAETAAAAAAVAATFSFETLTPKRLSGAYEFTHEEAASVPDIEQALRRDLADSVKSQMSNRIINGDESTNAHDVDGFATTLTAPANPSAVATYADYAGSHAQAVDGIHASMETEVSSVIGVDVYQHAATVYQAGSGESGSEALRRRSANCMASPYVGSADGTTHIHNLNIYHASGPNGGPMRGDSVAAMWPTLEVIRDIYTQASVGVVLTWVTLWDAQTAFRSAAYSRQAFDLV